jgi:hypothetical protein
MNGQVVYVGEGFGGRAWSHDRSHDHREWILSMPAKTFQSCVEIVADGLTKRESFDLEQSILSSIKEETGSLPTYNRENKGGCSITSRCEHCGEFTSKAHLGRWHKDGLCLSKDRTGDWAHNIFMMHKRFGVHKWIGNKVAEGDYDALRTFMKFRIDFLREELNETEKAYDTLDAEEIVDGLIDLCVVAIGTLDAFGVDAHKAWDAVHTANMAKEPGVKPSRPNPLGLPDLIKPEGWTAPSHADNHSILGILKG